MGVRRWKTYGVPDCVRFTSNRARLGRDGWRCEFEKHEGKQSDLRNHFAHSIETQSRGCFAHVESADARLAHALLNPGKGNSPRGGLGMARKRKTLPARGNDESLLMRSAESLGRLIGTLQRELEAARQFTARQGGVDARENGHAPARRRAVKSTSAATAHKTAAATSKTNTRARGDAKQSAAQAERVRSQQQRNRRARKSAK
jgi:hypothetical protein